MEIFDFRALETCNPDQLRQLASTYQDLSTHEKSLDYLIDLLQKDQLHDTLSLSSLDKTIAFYEVDFFAQTNFHFDRKVFVLYLAYL